MKDKEKINEEMGAVVEMASDIHTALLNCNNNYNCRSCEFRNDTPMGFCKAEYIAKAIAEKYQPKIDKDSVVLSREEYEKSFDIKVYNKIREENRLLKEQAELLRQEIITLSQELVNSRKKMAEKFYKKVRKLLKKVDIIVDGDEGLVGYEESAVDKGLTEIAKQFGVEIKE